MIYFNLKCKWKFWMLSKNKLKNGVFTRLCFTSVDWLGHRIWHWFSFRRKGLSKIFFKYWYMKICSKFSVFYVLLSKTKWKAFNFYCVQYMHNSWNILFKVVSIQLKIYIYIFSGPLLDLGKLKMHNAIFSFKVFLVEW